jgi:ABC-2 type transport system permease protein
MVMVVLFFVFLMTGSGLLLRSVTTEKENRLMEILMVSIAPRQLLIGKIIGLGVVSLLQVVVWLGCGYLMLRLGGNTLRLPEDFTFPAEILAWAIVLFLLGYTLYAALMAGAGALLPRVKESSQAAWVVMWPMFLAYMAAIILGMSRPSHLLMIAMSLFPLTSPLVMIVRITISDVPVWQLVVCVALLVVTVVLVVMAVERMFRAQTLISGQPFSARKYLQALLGRA